jgi:hypothetical protein
MDKMLSISFDESLEIRKMAQNAAKLIHPYKQRSALANEIIEKLWL